MPTPKRPVGRPPQSAEERAAKETIVDTHMLIPTSLVKAVDAVRREGESRKDYILRILRERDEIQDALAKQRGNHGKQ